jgi:hypothetical protein
MSALPMPAQAAASRSRFDQLLRNRPVRQPASASRRFGRLRLPRSLAAALVLSALGTALWLLSPGSDREVHAAEVVDQLLDWNLELTAGRSPGDRARIYSARAAALARGLQSAALPLAERELGELLLANGAWLAEHDDPVAEADRFNDVAERLVKQIAAAEVDDAAADRFGRRYGRLVEQGVAANLERAAASAESDIDRQKRIEAVARRSEQSVQALEELLGRVPPAARKGIERALAARKSRGRGNAGDLVPPGLQSKNDGGAMPKGKSKGPPDDFVPGSKGKGKGLMEKRKDGDRDELVPGPKVKGKGPSR